MQLLRLRPLPAALAVMSALILTACGNSGGSKPATQIAAKVGSEEISIHQINQVLARNNTANLSEREQRQISRDILERLIDQQLAVDQAVDKKLHRSPEIVAQIESTRREILARAYLKQITDAVAKPTEEEARKYYAENPALFAERKAFVLQEINTTAEPEVTKLFNDHASAGKSIEDLAKLLRERKIQFNSGSSTRMAEQIPLDLLPRMQAMKVGQSMVITTARTLSLVRVTDVKAAPVDQATALPRIEQYLTNQRTTEAVSAHFKDLRARTTIEYKGEFEKSAAEAASAAPAPVKLPADAARNAIDQGAAKLK
jgi:EpsD family peptidyl-prolyl cis-trans isomerase